MRLFFALWPSPEQAGALHGPLVSMVQGRGGRLVPVRNLHLTLAFLGHVEPSRLPLALEAAASFTVDAFEFRLDRLGYWRHGQVFWAGCSRQDERLQCLAASLAAALHQRGFRMEKRSFVPHVTLIRKLPVMPEDVPVFSPLLWPCREFVLVQSVPCDRGVDYKKLASWRLAIQGVNHDGKG